MRFELLHNSTEGRQNRSISGSLSSGKHRAKRNTNWYQFNQELAIGPPTWRTNHSQAVHLVNQASEWIVFPCHATIPTSNAPRSPLKIDTHMIMIYMPNLQSLVVTLTRHRCGWSHTIWHNKQYKKWHYLRNFKMVTYQYDLSLFAKQVKDQSCASKMYNVTQLASH